MLEIDFDVIERVQASLHGRQRIRHEERHLSDEAVTISREGGESLTGWALDRSASGARILLPTASAIEAGEVMTMELAGEFRIVRVIWTRYEGDACVLGLKRVTASGEFATTELASCALTMLSRVA